MHRSNSRFIRSPRAGGLSGQGLRVGIRVGRWNFVLLAQHRGIKRGVPYNCTGLSQNSPRCFLSSRHSGASARTTKGTGRMKHALFAATIVTGIAFAPSAMAQEADLRIGVGIPLAPGQAGTSPGQVFNSARASNPSSALPPGQLFIQNRTSNPTTALPPGQTFTNLGRKK
jgi:hypothetical protein